MQTLLIVLHVFVCLFLIITVLLQPGKTPGMGSAFGGASGSGNFGAKSPVTVLSKITVVLAAGFMLSSLTLAWMSVRDHSVSLDLSSETHHPTQGLAMPADDDAAEGVDVESGVGEEPAVDDPAGLDRPGEIGEGVGEEADP